MAAIISNGTGDLFESKWKKLLSRVWLFDLIPFADIVFVSGSMAIGNVYEDSDFDVIIGVKNGRIFTARAFCVAFFGLLGWRRKRGTEGRDAKDKFCFSHFVAPENYRLSEPHNDYWKKLYLSLTPVYGDKKSIQKFYDANSDWLGEKKNYKEDAKHLYKEKGVLKKIFEKILEGKFGNFAEIGLKNIQIKKIKKNLKTENLYKPRIICSGSELEFHPDTRRIEDMLASRTSIE